ncbi:MAG: prepilin-type N-terminal cleavage/methylation domain-containing protein [Phycisphaerales bacterium]
MPASQPLGARSAQAKASALPRAFSLIEVVVVIILVSVLAGVTLPRLTGGAARRAEQEVREVASLLSALALRESLSGRATALAYDTDAAELSVLVRDPTDTGDVQEREAADWYMPPLIRPVRLTETRVTRLLADGAAFPPGSFRIEMPQGQARPMIDLLVQLASANSSDAERCWQVTLDPGQTAAASRPLAGTTAFTPTQAESIDLDAAGRRTTPW